MVLKFDSMVRLACKVKMVFYFTGTFYTRLLLTRNSTFIE